MNRETDICAGCGEHIGDASLVCEDCWAFICRAIHPLFSAPKIIPIAEAIDQGGGYIPPYARRSIEYQRHLQDIEDPMTQFLEPRE